MRHGWIKCAAVTPEIRVADCEYNARSIVERFKFAAGQGARIVAAPELCVTGSTCGDLFYQETLLQGALNALSYIAKETTALDALLFVGLPLRRDGLIYNTAAALCRGEILGFVPKTFLPDYNEFYEKRHFCRAPDKNLRVAIEGREYHFGKKLLFCDKNIPELCVAAEFCQDMQAVTPPGVDHALAGATVLVNLSAGDETVGKANYRRMLISSYSSRLVCGLIYADAGRGESSADMVFSGHDMVAENGKILSEAELFGNGCAVSDVDVAYLAHERSRLFNCGYEAHEYEKLYFDLPVAETRLARDYGRLPFVPAESGELRERARLILRMQAEGLAKRIAHTGAKSVVVGVSGGLDSCLALLVAVRAKALADNGCKIIGVTMPCFGTTGRTYNNARRLVGALDAELREVDLKQAVSGHLTDIGHGGEKDVTYENAQARERTQTLMDIANMTGGFVVGTGDLSELALGWATYNGDHMSMYAVNASVPKTLIRHLVSCEAELSSGLLKDTLLDILDTPVSPELLPPEGEDISQKTEDIVGPYELHDFFLYYTVRAGFSPDKILRIALRSFEGVYDGSEIRRWLVTFVKRFFSQQFKRSCMPDGVKIGSVSLSPRGDWRMPSDAVSALWLAKIE